MALELNDPWAVVPVKELAHAKQRLAPVLAPAERRGLCRAMLEDVLATLRTSAGLAGMVVVTRDPEATELAQGYGARVLVQASDQGHTAAVDFARAVLIEQGARALLTVPGDVPLVTPAEIAQLLAAHNAQAQPRAVTIAPARDELGSNAVLCTPPDVLPLRFGANSFYPHLAAARARGVEPRAVYLPGVGLDIDQPGDLLAFCRQPAAATHAWRYLAASGVLARLKLPC